MPESRAVGGLKWVKGELIDSLRRVRGQLEAFLATNGQDELSDAISALYEVRGVLSALQMTAPARLAEEMQRLLERLASGQVPNRDEAAEALMLALIQLPHHLDRISAGHADPPVALLPSINDLRICRGSQPLKAAELLVPSSVLAELEAPTPEAIKALASVVAKVRPQFHRYLLLAFRGDGDQGLIGLGHLFNQLHRFFKEGVFCDAFRAAEAMVGGILDGSVPINPATKALLGHIDTVFKPVLATQPTWPEPQARSLIGELLTFLADLDPESPLVSELGAEYGIQTGAEGLSDLGEPSRRATLGNDAMASLAGEVLRELAVIEDRLDLFVRGGTEGTEQLASIEGVLHQLANALAIGDDQGLVGRLHALAEEIGAVSRGQTEADEAFFMGFAQDLLEVEDRLRQAAPSAEGGAHDAEALLGVTLREARADLAKAKEAIADYAVHPGDPRRLGDAPAVLPGVAAALHMLGEDAAAEVISGVSEVLRLRFVDGGQVPNPADLDLLAEAISGVDLHMEGLAQGASFGDRLVAQAHAAMEALAGPLPAAPGPDLAAAPVPPPVQRIEPKPPAATHGVDPELVEIFLEEAHEEQGHIEENLARWIENTADQDALAALRRSFHTLRGSGRLAGATRLAELAAVTESLLERVLARVLPASGAILGQVAAIASVLPGLIEAEASGRPTDLAPLMRATAGLLATPAPVAAPAAVAETAPETAGEETVEADPELLDIFVMEAREHLATLTSFLAAAGQATEVRPNPDMMRALHTLCGSARMTGIDSVAGVSGALEGLYRQLDDRGLMLDRTHCDLLERACKGLAERLDHLPLSGPEVQALAAVALDATERRGRLAATAPAQSLRPEYGLEALPESELAALEAEAWAAAADLVPEPEAMAPGVPVEPVPEPLAFEVQPVAELEPLAIEIPGLAEHEPLPIEVPGPAEPEPLSIEGPGLAEPEPLAIEVPGLAQPEPLAFEVQPAAEPEPLAIEVPGPAEPEPLSIEVPGLAEPEPLAIEVPGLAQPEPLAIEVPGPAEPEALAIEVPGPAQHEPAAIEGPVPAEPGPPAIELPVEPEVLPEGASEAGVAAGPVGEPGPAGPDVELLALFLEDARDILDRLDKRVREWQLAPQDSGPLQGIQRLLHTLKGSARLSGLAAIADLSHALESTLSAIAAGDLAVSDDALELTQRSLDTLSTQVDAAEQGASVPIAGDLVAALSGAQAPGAAREAEDLARLAPSPAPAPAPQDGRQPAPLAAPAAAEPARVPAAAQIRVRSDLLNRLVNNAGEISIYRARLSQQNGTLGYSLAELDQTVGRLRDQLRQLDMETEAQILYRYDRELSESDPSVRDFDPLELDRFSKLQQLSRSISETVNDLVSLKTLLADMQRESADLLVQQARIADDLQDGLLRTRMVPFVQMVPRLHRLVRQTAQSLGKRASLEVRGPEVELDRSILDRLVGPLEHLLRNAVAHGIETPAGRKAAGKKTEGAVVLVLSREGNDVVITLADDGAGMDLAAIRRRAVERGLLQAGIEVTEEELLQLTMEPGFTTVDQVTQIAGRGVGLDVVASDVKRLSGTVTLSSEAGRGTKIVLRLPLTLAIVDALLVTAGDATYAIPHASIEAAARIPRTDLDLYYQGRGQDFSRLGEDYRIMHLEGILHPGAKPELGERRWLPLLLVRTADQRLALQVDSLIGTQRIVVKPLGPQLSTVRWLNGGTILPDGRVAMILDLVALARSPAIHSYRLAAAQLAGEERRPACVMVVDDSLTVRRVTGRLLRRQNMDVMTAKDGVEALTLLEDRVPDLILLDIEMPRMDGYELTRHIRRSPRFAAIPIIMITSRTGEKHRRLAMELGVNRYLGKPYQETELLDEISAVLMEAPA